MNTVIRYTYDERLFGGPQAKVVAEKNSEKKRSPEFTLLIKVQSENSPEGLTQLPLKFKRIEGVTSCLQCHAKLTQASDHHVVSHGLSSVHFDLNRKKARLAPKPKSAADFFTISKNASSSGSSSSSRSSSTFQSPFQSSSGRAVLQSPFDSTCVNILQQGAFGTPVATVATVVPVVTTVDICEGIMWPLKPFSTTFPFAAVDEQLIGYSRTSLEAGSLFIGKCMFERQPLVL
jgi:hypothetical protein